MTQPRMDWDSAYQQNTPPPWSIGAPQPELAALIEQGKVRSEVLDAGCGHAALSLALAAQGYQVVGLDASETAVVAARAAAAVRGLDSAAFAQADITDFDGYDGRFNTVMDSGLLHALPVDRRQEYVRCIHRAAAPGAGLFILAFAKEAFGADTAGPNGFAAEELRDTVATLWTVDDVRPAILYANDTSVAGGQNPAGDVTRDDAGRLMMPGFLLSAHKES
ncbi:class I SAM-dependent methyltransferase [Mycobacterium intracellulare]|uniref:class I SAM-dependent methyltransferase n=1 Tax=Mycobacterium intracellulare TaxID=1767 RepID=UPI00335D632D